MDIYSEERNLKIALKNLDIAEKLLPEIIKEANLEEYHDTLWSEIDARKKELDRLTRIIKAKKNQLDNSSSIHLFKIPLSIRYVQYPSKGEIIIGDKTKITLRGRLSFYIYYLAQRNIDDRIAQKHHLDIGWLEDEDFLKFEHGWKTVEAVRSIRKNVIKHLKRCPELIEKAYVGIHNNNKGFRISSPCILIEDKLPKD